MSETEDTKEAENKSVKLKAGAKVVWQRTKGHTGAIVTFSVLGLVLTIGNSAIPYITGKIFDAIQTGSSIELIGGLTASLGALLIAFGVIQLLANLVDWQLSLRMEKLGHVVEGEFLSDAVRKLFKLPLSFFHDRKLGDTITRIHRARNAFDQIVSEIPQVVPPVASIFVALILTFLINTTLSFVLLAGVVIFALFFSRAVKPFAELQRKLHEAWSDLFGNAWDALGNPRVVKLLQMEDEEADSVDHEFTTSALPAWLVIFTGWQKLSLIQRIVVLTTQVLILVIGAPLVQQGVLSIGDLIAFNAYAGLVFGPFVRLGRQWQRMQDGLVDIIKTEEMLDIQPENYSERSAEKVNLLGDIVFQGVSFSYDDEEGDVLSDLTFTAPAASTVAIIGKSGEGKSTLVDLIPRFIEPTKGDITINGKNLKDIGLQDLRSRIALVPQRVNLFNKTIRENIAYGRSNASEEEIVEAARKSQALEFIEKSHNGFESKVGEKGLKLSAGQAQRIAIARAFLADPDILILDEPTSALDAHNEKLIVDVMEDLMEGRTTFIIAHRLSTVKSADMILVIDGGKVAESGTHEELITKDGEYKKLYDLQIGLH